MYTDFCIVFPRSFYKRTEFVLSCVFFPFSATLDLLPFGSLASCSLTLRPWRLLNQRSEASLSGTLPYSITPSTCWKHIAHLCLVRSSCC